MAPPGFAIRPFDQRDQADARALLLQGLGEHFGFIDESRNPDLDDIAAHYLTRGGIFLVAERDGRLAATGALVPEGPTTGRLVRMSVAAASRRAGLGRAMVAHLLACARERGYRRVVLETNEEWQDAIGLYRACGFVEYARGEGLVHLARDLEDIAVEIRELTAADAEIYWPLRLRALREEPEAFGASYEESVNRPLADTTARLREIAASAYAFMLGAFAGDTLVGTVRLDAETSQKERHRAGIYGVYVAPEARGRGVGRALLAEAIARARTMPDLLQLHLGVNSRNKPAKALYTALGFETYGIEPRALRIGDTFVDEDLMVLRLDAE